MKDAKCVAIWILAIFHSGDPLSSYPKLPATKGMRLRRIQLPVTNCLRAIMVALGVLQYQSDLGTFLKYNQSILNKVGLVFAGGEMGS